MAIPTSSRKNIVILGGSYAGISTAHYLLKHAIPCLPHPETYKVVLISPSTEAMCRPACPRAMISDDFFAQDKLFVSIPRLFEQYPSQNFRFEQGSAINLNHDSRTVIVSSATQQTEKTVEFHALVIATGASTPSPLLGINRDTETLRANWASFRNTLSTAKSILIAGGGPAGIETAGELGEYLNGRAGLLKCKLENPKVAITVVTHGPKILPVLRDSISQTAESYLAKVGVTILKNTKVVSVDPPIAGNGVASKTTTTVRLSDGQILEADIYIPATGTSPNTDFLAKTLLAPDGRIQTGPTLRVDKAGPRIYAIGDAANYARPAVHSILSAVPVLCANIKRDLLLVAEVPQLAVAEDRLFQEDTRETQMVPIGQSKGVGAAMGYALPSLVVWLIKGRDYWLWTTGGLWNGNQWAKET